MIKAKISIALAATIFSACSHALSPDATDGKLLYQGCGTCHEQALSPPKAPPMWEIKRLYERQAKDDATLVKNIVSFTKEPSLETAIHDVGVERYGLMPAMPLPDDMLNKIATYILEEEFPPPCDYWNYALTRAKATDKTEFERWYQRMFRRSCSGK